MSVAAQTPRISDETLARLLRWGSVVLVALIAFFGVFYVLTQRVDPGPSALDRTVTAAEQSVVKDPRNVAARMTLASAYHQAGRLDDSVTQYSEILKVSKANVDALLARGQVYLEQGKATQAAADFSAITGTAKGGEFARIDERTAAAHYFLGTILLQQGKAAQAVTEVQAALTTDPTDSDAFYVLGQALAAQQQWSPAASAYLSALRFVPTGWCEPYDGLQTAWSKLGQTPQASYAGAMAQICRGDTATATQTLQGLTSGPMAADAMVGLGLAAETSGDSKAAADWYRKAIAKDPKNENAAAGLNRVGTSDGLTTSAAK
jgi:tetratricopeptide (TPR) repeat protein